MTTKIRILCRPNVWLEIDCDTPADAVKEMSLYQEILSEEKCGRMDCGSTEVRFEHRLAQGYDFYGMTCMKCRARIDLGQIKEGDGMWFKRKLPNGEYDKDHNGWYMWKERQDQPRQGEQTAHPTGGQAYSEPIVTNAPGPNAPKDEDVPF